MESGDIFEALDYRFGLPGLAQVVEGNGRLAMVRITSPTASGEIYLHGAQVTSWKPKGREEVLFVSTQSRWGDGRAIRGGIPICFPWFGDKGDNSQAPAHGFVRTKLWQLESIVQAKDTITVSLFTGSDENTKKWWPADFRLVHRVAFGSELSLELILTNTGSTRLRFEEALHTYLRVGQVEKVRIRGLASIHYLDKTDLNREKIQQGEIAINTETDRIYLNTQHPIDLEDPTLHRRIRVAKEKSFTTVVWNPSVLKSRALSDLGEAAWKQMICIESSNVSRFAVDLDPGQQHTMKAIISVLDL